MCGFFGVLGDGKVNFDEMLKSLKAINHRGPDDFGVWDDIDDKISLGHNRLSIVDLSSSGHQPMISSNKRYVITATRTRRRENYIFKILYKLHLLITFIFTLEWISFGNYSSFHSQNLKKILKNNLSWLAYSSCIVSNCNIYKVSSERQKRFFGKSKLSFFQLFKHSFRILSVFQKRILFISFFYIFILIIFDSLDMISSFTFVGVVIILLINYLINFTKEITFKDYLKKDTHIKKITKLK